MEQFAPPKKSKKPWIIASIIVCLLTAGLLVWFFVIHHAPKDAQIATTHQKDTTPPTIDFSDTSLTEGVELTGTVTLPVTARDNVGVDKVSYAVDGVFFAVTYAPPFSLTLDTTKLTAGKHTLVATAYDRAGNHTATKDLPFTVAETTAVAEPSTPAASSPTPTKQPSASTGNTSGGSSSDNGGTTTPPPPAPSDTQAPTAPTNVLLSASGAYIVNVSWTASTDNVAVANYHILRDGVDIGSSTTTSYIDFTVVPGNTYLYKVVAYDAASNNTASPTEPSITLAPTSLWMDFDTPATLGHDGTPLELGVKFRPTVNGKITGVRFYKAVGDPSPHTGNLWLNSSGANLATVAFSGETASGWQQATFATPVDVTAGTTYVVSFFTPNGDYGATSGYFATEGMNSQYLTALASGVDGNNGVFRAAGTSGFPNSSFGDANYWVDATFVPNKSAGGPTVTTAAPSEIFAGYPGANNTGVVNKRLPTRNRAPTLTAGMTIHDVEFRNAGMSITANNITFSNVKFTYTGVLNALQTFVNITNGTNGTVFQDCEIDGQDNIERAVSGLDDGVVTRCNIHDVATAVNIKENLTVQDSYLHNLFTPVGQSWVSNGVKTAPTATNITVQRNTIFLTGNQTAAVNIQGGGSDTLSNVLVDSNLLAGGNYAVAAGANSSINFRVTNNKFSTRSFPKVGATNIYDPAWIVDVIVTGNTLYETGASANSNLP